MITEAIIPEVKKAVGNFENPIFQHYLENEMRIRYQCPVCEKVCASFKERFLHIHTTHKSKLETEEVQAALDPLNRLKQITKDKKDSEVIGMGKFFGEKIISEHNQHVLVNLIGKTGMGKSNASMRIGEEVSKYIASVKGGSPNDYFNISNIAIMRLDSVVPIIEDLDNKQFNIIILDDIGASYSARDFNKAINKNINKIFQTFRDTNTMVILTMPDTLMIDVVARRLAHFQIEITEARHDEGISVGKLFQIFEQYRKNSRPHYHFVNYAGIKYTKIAFTRAGDELVNEYETKRKEIRKLMMAESIETIKKADSEILNNKTKKLPKHVTIAEQIKTKLAANPDLSDRALSLELTTSRDTIRKAKKLLNDSGVL